MPTDDDDDVPQLSADTLAILQSFLTEKQEVEEKFEKLRSAVHIEADAAAERAKQELDVKDFGEDWQLSPILANKLAKEALDATADGGSIACVSSPSVFIKLMKMDLKSRNINAYVLEFDRRFEVYGSHFLFFDFNQPPSHLSHESFFDTLVVDPPFLSDECWTKTSEAVRWLAKSVGEGMEWKTKSKIIVCTGMVMEKKIEAELGCKVTAFKPRHRGERLRNDFGCFGELQRTWGF
ncbi:putative N6-adenine methyltransferase-domain-containing protein [Chytridium lagenaria]|nr:putative N6-adenine methyltransferase-domain-containing protein [Chytridium lagenaria]